MQLSNAQDAIKTTFQRKKSSPDIYSRP